MKKFLAMILFYAFSECIAQETTGASSQAIMNIMNTMDTKSDQKNISNNVISSLAFEDNAVLLQEALDIVSRLNLSATASSNLDYLDALRNLPETNVSMDVFSNSDFGEAPNTESRQNISATSSILNSLDALRNFAQKNFTMNVYSNSGFGASSGENRRTAPANTTSISDHFNAERKFAKKNASREVMPSSVAGADTDIYQARMEMMSNFTSKSTDVKPTSNMAIRHVATTPTNEVTTSGANNYFRTKAVFNVLIVVFITLIMH